MMTCMPSYTPAVSDVGDVRNSSQAKALGRSGAQPCSKYRNITPNDIARECCAEGNTKESVLGRRPTFSRIRSQSSRVFSRSC
ncbi:hypothetical protein BaRGS_00007754, partial [Batillaria attramentaria]